MFKSCLSAAVTHHLTSTVLGTNTSKNDLKPSHESSIGYFMRSVFSLLRYIMNQYDNLLHVLWYRLCRLTVTEVETSILGTSTWLCIQRDWAKTMLAMATKKKNTWRTANEAMLSAIAPILSGDSIQFHSGSGKTKTETGKFLSRGKSWNSYNSSVVLSDMVWII